MQTKEPLGEIYDARKRQTVEASRLQNVLVWVFGDVLTTKSTFKFREVDVSHPH